MQYCIGSPANEPKRVKQGEPSLNSIDSVNKEHALSFLSQEWMNRIILLTTFNIKVKGHAAIMSLIGQTRRGKWG